MEPCKALHLRTSLGMGCGTRFHLANRREELQRLRRIAREASEEQWTHRLPRTEQEQQQNRPAKERTLEEPGDLGYLIVYPTAKGFGWDLSHVRTREKQRRNNAAMDGFTYEHSGSVTMKLREGAKLQPRQGEVPRPPAAAPAPCPYMQTVGEEMQAPDWALELQTKPGHVKKPLSFWLHRCRGVHGNCNLRMLEVPAPGTYRVVEAPEPLQRFLSLQYCMARFLGNVELSVSGIEELSHELGREMDRTGVGSLDGGVMDGGISSRRAPLQLLLKQAFTQVLQQQQLPRIGCLAVQFWLCCFCCSILGDVEGVSLFRTLAYV